MEDYTIIHVHYFGIYKEIEHASELVMLLNRIDEQGMYEYVGHVGADVVLKPKAYPKKDPIYYGHERQDS